MQVLVIANHMIHTCVENTFSSKIKDVIKKNSSEMILHLGFFLCGHYLFSTFLQYFSKSPDDQLRKTTPS